MLRLIKSYHNDEGGATATEYAMLLVVVALAIAIGAQVLGSDIQALFTNIGTTLNISPLTLPAAPTP